MTIFRNFPRLDLHKGRVRYLTSIGQLIKKGLVTVVLPIAASTERELRQESASPEGSRATIDVLLSSTRASTSQTLPETSSTIPVKTTPIVTATTGTATPASSRPTGMPGPSVTCPSGFFKCADGTCEPFEAVCGKGGVVTVVFPTEMPTSMPLVSDSTTSDGPIPVTNMVSVLSGSSSTPGSVQTSDSTDSPGTCPSGFVQCVDGNCEPFEALCGEGGIVTVIFPTNEPTTTKRLTMSSVTGSLAMVDSTSETTPTTVATTTVTVAIVTDSSGKEICLDGWELCKDGKCEPFHWMCTEHDGTTALIG